MSIWTKLLPLKRLDESNVQSLRIELAKLKADHAETRAQVEAHHRALLVTDLNLNTIFSMLKKEA